MQPKCMETGKEHEAILAAVNPLLGRGTFVFIKLSASWKLLKTRASPECNALSKQVSGEGFRWITSGFMHVLIVDEEKNQAYPLFVEAKEFRNNVQALEFMKKRFQKLGDEGMVVEKRSAQVGGHEANYVIWTSRKKMFLRRGETTLSHLEWATYCDRTSRLLLFRVSSSRVEDFMRDKEKMLSMLSSITCHS